MTPTQDHRRTPRLPVTVVVGTRPEVLKMAPVLRAMRARGAFDIDLCAVAQHGALLDQALRDADLTPTARLSLGDGALALGDGLAATVSAVSARLRVCAGRALLVQGDTTSALGGALAGFYAGVPVAHVEAGLRSGDPAAPFPEEMHRALVDRLSAVLYAPSDQARENLLREGFAPSRVVQVGNTAIDAVRALGAEGFAPSRAGSPRVLVTCHRRESFGDGVREVCDAVRSLVEAHPTVEVDYVLHPHPGAHEPPEARLREVARVRLHAPMPHADFLDLLRRAAVVLTDSGGVQEEAAFLGRPLLVLRSGTERVEAVQRGVARIVGTHPATVVPAVLAALRDDVAPAMPFLDYGDGDAGRRIAEDLHRRLEHGW
ncbi:MAG: UDP-N-acetylglucosamine 2-epimerase (non-hydrolyzing) [Polyangiales bacterium]